MRLRIGAAWDDQVAAVNYRAVQPLTELARRGHEIIWPATSRGDVDVERLRRCDLIHVYRVCDRQTQAVIRELAAHGAAITWDNDDDYSSVPEDSELFRSSGADGIAKMLRLSVRAASFASVVTVPSPWLADRYRSLGVRYVEAIESCPWETDRPRRRHDGLVIGWIAGSEHQSDAEQLDVSGVLRRIQAAHPDVHVVSIGARLELGERYDHTRHVPFPDLPERMGAFDIGIAPVADRPHNHARSSIKVREYAASGVPWLASDLTPYHGLGDEQGGRLVSDEGWFEALDRLICEPAERRRLAKNGRAWIRTQRIGTVAASWETTFAQAISRKRGTLPG